MKSTKPSFESLNIFKEIPFSSQSVPAGFPSPADDFLEFDLSLDKKLIKHPGATFFVRVSGNSMVNAKIFDGSILLVDRAEEIKNGDIVLVVIDGDFTVKRYKKLGENIFLYPENKNMSPIKITKNSESYVWGKVMWSFNRVR
jgi:DNA polymerase V|tara:strand:- start:262 stop:690 length:429 start_codon:yes stop_codon:yes gene_type:complete